VDPCYIWRCRLPVLNVQCPMNFECPLWNFRIFLERILWKKYVETKHPTAVYQMMYSAFVDLCYFWRCRLPVLNVQCPMSNELRMSIMKFSHISWNNSMKKICGNKIPCSSLSNDILSIRGSLLFLVLPTTRSECPMSMHERCECPLWNFRIFLEIILWKKYVETKHPTALYWMI